MDDIWITLTQLGFARYQVSCTGKIRNVGAGKLLKGRERYGYVTVQLYNDQNKIKEKQVHVLVASMFCLKYSDQQTTVDHINRIKNDNHHLNLRWATPSEQALNRVRTEQKNKYRPVCQPGTGSTR